MKQAYIGWCRHCGLSQETKIDWSLYHPEGLVTHYAFVYCNRCDMRVRVREDAVIKEA